MKPKFYYHCSSDWHGEEFSPVRRTPKEMSKKEPPTPRLCVCPTIAGCFAARMMRHHRPVYVYKTVKPYRAIAPRNVWDQIVTRERWLIPPVRLNHVATINALYVDKIQDAALHYHLMTRKNSDLLNRVAQYLIAHEVVGGPAWERRLLNRWRSHFKIGNPERFLANKVAKFMLS